MLRRIRHQVTSARLSVSTARSVQATEPACTWPVPKTCEAPLACQPSQRSLSCCRRHRARTAATRRVATRCGITNPLSARLHSMFLISFAPFWLFLSGFFFSGLWFRGKTPLLWLYRSNGDLADQVLAAVCQVRLLFSGEGARSRAMSFNLYVAHVQEPFLDRLSFPSRRPPGNSELDIHRRHISPEPSETLAQRLLGALRTDGHEEAHLTHSME